MQTHSIYSRLLILCFICGTYGRRSSGKKVFCKLTRKEYRNFTYLKTGSLVNTTRVANGDSVVQQCSVGSKRSNSTCINGRWTPAFKFCPYPQKKKCTIPEQNVYKGSIKNAEGTILSEDSQVESGQTVTFQCPRGFAPEVLDLTCNAEGWNTVDGNLPVCKEGARCLIENSSSILYTDGYTGDLVRPGETVKHGHLVVALCDPELTLSAQYDDDFESNLTCSDGELLGHLPVCPDPSVPCPDVPNGQIKKYPQFIPQVKCGDGFQLEEEMYFNCDRNGTWSPFVPKCIAKKCIIPEQNVYKGSIKNAEGAILSEDTQVESGQTITFQCPRGFAPGVLDLTCHAERWNTVDGKLPVCKEVFCSHPPPVRNSSYAPHLRVYRFGDVVKINDCQGNLEQVGPPDLRIECLANGSWSASFYCRKFCDGGTIEEVKYSNQIVKAKPAKSFSQIPNVEKCRKRCKKKKKFLCLSYLYGFDSDKRRYVCLLFKVDPSKNSRLLKPKRNHFVFARTCKE